MTLLFSNRQYVIGPRQRLARGPDAGSRSSGSNRFTASSSAASTFTRRSTFPNCRRPPKGRSASSTRNGCGEKTRNSGRTRNCPCQQEFIFASTGTKDKKDPPDKYVSALAGSDIETNPPATNAAIQAMPGKTFTRMIDQLPPQAVLDEIDKKVDFAKLEEVLMDEGTKKFADPFKSLLALIAEKRAAADDGRPPMSDRSEFDPADRRSAESGRAARRPSSACGCRAKWRWAATARFRTATPS